MRLVKARVQNYRSIVDSGEFDVERLKTILVGPNEAGKTVLLKALQQLNKPEDIDGFDALRDYPRSKYNDITSGKVKPESIEVVTGYFELEEDDKQLIPTEFHNCKYKLYRTLSNNSYHSLIDAPSKIIVKDVNKSLIRMASHMDKQYANTSVVEASVKPSDALKEINGEWGESDILSVEMSEFLKKWLDENYEFVEEGNETEEARHSELLNKIKCNKNHDDVLNILGKRVPVLIMFNNYFNVKPLIHLEHLAQRVEQNLLDDKYYDYGNLCLLKLLGFTARELATLGSTTSPSINDKEALKLYRDKLDSRSYQLNAASVRLTKEIRSVWMPNPNRPEADKLKVTADGQYLKVVVEDDLGVEVELDQRSEGFQWLVSFFVVFFSEATDKHKNAILLLDEPGMSLHALKQRDFRDTISRLSEKNQTLFSTHSPFLVGPNELDIVRVVEMASREVGTTVHTTLSSEDPAGMLPLQEALGYDLASSLFSQQRNLVLEGITDYWYIEATSELLKESDDVTLNEKIALVFANTAGKVVYYATILHAHKLKVAALLDSDNAGDQAAQQENLVHALGNKNILRTKDFCSIEKAEIEDLLRNTLVLIAKEEFGVDVSAIAAQQSNRPIVELFSKEISGFSKYKLAKAYIRWTRTKTANDLDPCELVQWRKLIEQINKSLK
ncbi:MAG: AAA family ATPase [Methylobacter sp.]|nr:AAA family ATPase [Methylobacter sp.]MDP2100484.1 AAA family ATPase [Methylobacter sp.]MDP2428225.1 AAA family ATPase [Methylobacter sp.]MDP3054065.1 AAA family ATPase [Methylobacter sp.]MDP3362285.1 AAA family ATPase [Methylobacter sp.]